MFRHLPALIAVVLVSPAPAQERRGENTFAVTVAAHYAKWAAGLPGHRLTPQRIDRLVNDPNVCGDEAAAVAAIHKQFAAKNPPNTLDKTALLKPFAGSATRPDEVATVVNFEAEFTAFRSHLRSIPREMFATDSPQRTGIRQGHLGDCFVVCGLGELATRHPARLKKMIAAEGDGTYAVTLPGEVKVTVPKLTDAQIALGSTAGKQGLWVNVLEQAVAIRLRKSGGSAVAIDAISNGGNPGAVLELLTHHKIEVTRLHRTGAKRDEVLAAIRKQLTDAQAHHRMACAGTGKVGPFPPGIASHHAYAVTGFDPAADTVTLWNPWGNTFHPTGPAGPTRGYATKSGKFTMPLKEFEAVFQHLFVETAKRVEDK